MSFIVFGLNHETASVTVREAFALDEGQLSRLYREQATANPAEFMLLATCNRTEVYLFGAPHQAAALQQRLSTVAGVPWPHAHAFMLRDEAALRHVIERLPCAT